MPLRSRICVVAFKIEAVVGTAESLTAAEAAFVSYNATLTRDVDVDERPGGTGFQQHTAVTGGRRATIEYETDFVGSGSDGTPPAWMTQATACGMDLSTDVLTTGTTTRTATIAIYRDGLVEKIAGAAGTFQLVLNAGRAARLKFTFNGKLTSDADVAVPTPTYPTTVPPRWAGGTCTVHSLACKASTLTFDRGAETVMREDPTDATGYIAAHYVDAKPTIVLDPETDLVATKNWQSIMEAHTEGAVSVAVGTTTGNILTIATTTAQVTRCPNTERNKLITRDLALQVNGAASLSITQS